MSSQPDPDAAALERLSALVDGELDPASAAQVCETWRVDAVARMSWHRYQLIGDVLRSDDLASAADRDMKFLVDLRSRLADEPMLIADAAASNVHFIGNARRAERRARWLVPSAVAAGFVMVVGVYSVTRDGAGSRGPVFLADARPAPAPRAEPQAPGTAGTAPIVLASGQVIRDARLDRYLAAHKQFAGSSALGMPSAFLRSATVDASAR